MTVAAGLQTPRIKRLMISSTDCGLGRYRRRAPFDVKHVGTETSMSMLSPGEGSIFPDYAKSLSWNEYSERIESFESTNGFRYCKR